jgi:N-acetylneuraminic acid mutarotase
MNLRYLPVFVVMTVLGCDGGGASPAGGPGETGSGPSSGPGGAGMSGGGPTMPAPTDAGAGSGGGGPGGADTRPAAEPSPHAGQWVGKTSQGLPLQFSISKDGIVEGLLMQVRMNLANATCTANFWPSQVATLDGSSLSTVASFPLGSQTTTIKGTLAPGNAQGTFTGVSGGYFLVCGGTLSIGSGTLFSDGTWQAAPGPVSCPTANDGECDEPGVCLVGTDGADCRGPAGSGSWKPINAAGAPDGRFFAASVWTGTEMIVWGGRGTGAGKLNTGARYNPARDSWLPISTTGAPTARELAGAVWTGTEMIVWGGAGTASNEYFNNGARYNPSTDSWAPLSTTGAPAPRTAAGRVVWTGEEMLVWGGSGASGPFFGDGGRYNPKTDSWTPISTTGAPVARTLHTLVWTGSEAIVWGGSTGSTSSSTDVANGARYKPASDSWSPLSAAGAPSARSEQVAVWSGAEMIVWAGSTRSGDLKDGARYNPATDSWTAISTTGAPIARSDLSAFWTGKEMIVWGDGSAIASGFLNTGGRYDPATNSWTATAITGAPSPRRNEAAVWTGTELILWGGYDRTVLNSGGRFTP